MSSAALDEKDPYNRLLARQNRFRVDAEVVHDTVLAVSGLLAEKFGGTEREARSAGRLSWRVEFSRSASTRLAAGMICTVARLYTHWQRTFLHPSLVAFDAPSREECTVNRVNSNTPLQALVLLNDPIYVEAAHAFAKRIGAHGKNLDGASRLGVSAGVESYSGQDGAARS